MRRAIFVAFAHAITHVSAANAQNVLLNPDLDFNVDHWIASGNCGGAFWDGVVGSPSSGSLAVNCIGSGMLSETVTQCVSLVSPGRVDFLVRWTENGSLPGQGAVYSSLQTFDGPACTGSPLALFDAAASGTEFGVPCCESTWKAESLLDQPLGAATKSALVALNVGAGADVVFDHITLRKAVIYSDGFE